MFCALWVVKFLLGYFSHELPFPLALSCRVLGMFLNLESVNCCFVVFKQLRWENI